MFNLRQGSPRLAAFSEARKMEAQLRLTETIPATPIEVERSLRHDNIRALTSGNAGKILPLAYVPLLREDRVVNSTVDIRVDMAETAEMLLNAVNVTAYAHFVPHLASDRFNGMDQFNRSYKGEPETEGGLPIPFIETLAFGTSPIWTTMGMHARGAEHVNAFPMEAYNLIVNHRRKARSAKLNLRDRLDQSLAAAFWHHTTMGHIVPDFDQAMIDGEVPLALSGGMLPVKGIGTTAYPGSAQTQLREATGERRDYTRAVNGGSTYVEIDPATGFPQVFAEMQADGLTVTLSNLELAKKTAAFAKLRSQYDGLDDDHLIDLLMSGIRVPEAQLSQPILLDRQSTIIGYNKRYATDAANLTESVTSGETGLRLRLRTPEMNTGGVIMITLEIVPEQLFERQKDYYLHAQSVDEFPEFIRDYLDPEKVAVVPNEHVDVDHATPDATFGYAPLNHEWKRDHPRIGGKFYRPDVDASFDEDRQRIWANETPNPTLTEDFYLATNLHQKVFADTQADAFEIVTTGRVEIVGKTVFGKGLHEATDDYDKLLDQVDTDRIDQGENT